MKSFYQLAVLLLVLGLCLSTVAAQEMPSNLTDDCVQNDDPEVDYFPEKVTLQHSETWSVEYFNHYKVVTVDMALGDTADTYRYLLVQCGTPVPEGFEDALTIEVPTGGIITMSTTFLPHLKQLDLLDNLLALDSFLYASTPEVLAMIDEGRLFEVGFGGALNVEAVLEAEPGVVLAHSTGTPEFDSFPVLEQAGVPVVMVTDWLETTPLGRAEWVKFVALFYNREAQANTVFEQEAGRYEGLTALTATLSEADKPVVLWGSPYQGTWYIPGGQSYVARLLYDAGANVVLADHPQVVNETGGVSFSFEAVFDAGYNAGYWFPGAMLVPTLADFLAQDERFASFEAVQNGQVYNNDLRENENGGNDYFETGAASPSLVLADLIAIMHPTLLADHTFTFFRPMQPAG